MTQLMATPMAVIEPHVSCIPDGGRMTGVENKNCEPEVRMAVGIIGVDNASSMPTFAVQQEAASASGLFDSTCLNSDGEVMSPADVLRAGTEVRMEEIGEMRLIERSQTSILPTSSVCSLTNTEPVASGSGRVDCVTTDVGLLPRPAEGWARDAQMVEGIFRIMEGMEPPWITLDVLEAATVRFPTIDREMLRRTIMTVMMTQRRCVVRLTRAGLRRGARTDRDGNSFVELDLDFADRYSMSH